MARISTGTGDEGTTGLVSGARVPKTHPRVVAYGAVDEANDVLGLAQVKVQDPDRREVLREIQRHLFTLGADLATPEGVEQAVRIRAEQVGYVEARTQELEERLPPLRRFILPGGTEGAATLQLARSVTRRAERDAWRLAELEDVNRHALVYLNRLSDLLFLLARAENRDAGVEDEQWLSS